MAKNTGKTSEDIFENALTAVGAFVLRNTDLYDAAKKRLVTGNKPSDFLVTYGETWYAEVKSIESGNRFSFSSIQQEQWRVATRVNKAGGKYFFYLHFMAEDQWFKVPASVILQSDKKSLTITDVANHRVFFGHVTS